ncbi:DUF1015 domain-containing protein [Schlesneria paludicola]|uniref:DUF1015 domain-containing protein n=1 Tax=Schlesneria paludicola TaxID=360056 RepID=UPI00029ABE5D|nr:DUF1015 domain-containing protein [Schlesneria paludicola]
MVDVSPFRGWRYDVSQVGDLSDVITPPYDVIDTQFQDRLYKVHPCNFIRLELNRSEPSDTDANAKYGRAADFLKHWKLDGVLQMEPEDALYVYSQEFTWEGSTYIRGGFMARIRLEEFGTGNVFPHEQTLSGPKLDRLMLIRATNANLSPIFGLYPDETASVQRILDDACLKLTPSQATDHLGVIHRLWVVTDHQVIGQVKAGLRDQPVFIADGHHRYETALNYRKELKAAGKLNDDQAAANFVLMHFVGMQDPGLQILPTHRLVSGLPATLTSGQVAEALKSCCEVDVIGQGDKAATETWELIEADGGQDVFGFGTAADDTWLFVRILDNSLMSTLAADHSEAWQLLGVSMLHRLLLEELILKSVGGDPKFQYVHRLDETTAALHAKTHQLACLVAPATIEDVREIAAGRETMPPKSTYFYPKLLSGLVVHSLS